MACSLSCKRRILLEHPVPLTRMISLAVLCRRSNLRMQKAGSAQPVPDPNAFAALVVEHTPGAANSVLQKLKVLLHFAIDNNWRKDDPTLRMKKFAKGEFHTWMEEELEQFERKWPIGTTERLAYSPLLYTGQRRSDVVAMSWVDVNDGTICVVPLKTRRTSGLKLWIPIHPACWPPATARR